ncbi:uncharacterized protein HaLaN_00720, partial [Haematococcus lacustris]
ALAMRMLCPSTLAVCTSGSSAPRNSVKAPKKLKMSNKEKKALQKLREARKARGEEVTDSEEDA